MPLVDGLNVAEYHPVLAFAKVLWHGDFSGVLLVFGLPHETDVLHALLQVVDIHLKKSKFIVDKVLFDKDTQFFEVISRV